MDFNGFKFFHLFINPHKFSNFFIGNWIILKKNNLDCFAKFITSFKFLKTSLGSDIRK